MNSNVMRFRILMKFVCSALALFVAHLPVQAGNGSWIYDANSTWSTASRWSPAVVPGTTAGDVVYFTNNITAHRTVTMDTTSRTVGTLIFCDLTSPYFNFTLIPSGGATLTFNNSGSGASLVQTNNTSTADTVSVPVILVENLLITNRGAVTLSGAISGAGKSITKTGTGLLALAGTNSYSGGTFVNNGQLSVLKVASLPSTGTVTVANAATLAIGAGGTGTFSASDIDALYANNMSGISLGASSVVGVDTTIGAFTYSSALSGTRGFAKFGANNLILPVANAHSGATVVYGGVLELEHAQALPGGLGATGGSSALVFNGGVLGLGVGDFTRNLASASTASGVNFTGAGGWAAYNADRVVNLGGAGATITWANANTGLNGQRLLLSAPTATHSVEMQNPLNMGSNSRTIQVDDGAAAVDAVISASISGQSGAALYKWGAGTLGLTAVNTYAGQTWVSGGTLLLTGNASIGTAGSSVLTLGQQYLGSGVLQYNSSATSYFSAINVSQSNSATGTLNQTSGMISVSGNVNLSPTADCGSFLNVSGGTFAVGGMLAVGQRGNGAGIMTLSNTGVVVASVMVVPDYSNNPSNTKPSYGQFIQNGGSAMVGSLIISQTSYDTNPHVGSVDLNGGTFSTASVTGGVATVAGGSNTSTFNFNGGTLKATTSTPAFMQGLTAAYVKDGGAFIDSDGYDITIAQALLHAAGAATSPLVKNGTGTLTLTGANTVIGPVTINTGTLVLTGATQFASGRLSTALSNNGSLIFAGSADQVLAGAITGSGALTKRGSGTLTLTGVTPYSGNTMILAGQFVVFSGGSLSNSAVTLSTGALLNMHVESGSDPWVCKGLTLTGETATVRLHFYSIVPSQTVAPILVQGDFVNQATLTISVDGVIVNTDASYPLIQYTGNFTGSGSLGSVILPNGGVGTLVHHPETKTIELSVTTAVTPLVWNGNSGDWDIGTSANWTGFRSTYAEGDLVLFDDTTSGTGPLTVTLLATVNPNNVVFNTTTKAYTLSGSGMLAGEAGIFKKGTAALTLAHANTSTGGLVIDNNAGLVTASLALTSDALGSGPVVIGTGSTLTLENANTTSATVTKDNRVSGQGLLKIAFATNTTPRVTTLSGLSGFAGTVQVGSASAATGDKLDMAGAQAPQATVQIESGHTVYVGSDGAPVRLSSVMLGGSGNAENRGALRFASNASKLEAAVSLVSDATIASDSTAATLDGTISGTAGSGATNVLTQGTTASAVGLTVSGVINDGSNGGRVALVQSKGKLTLTTNNTYSGGTTINGGGTLQLGANDALPSSSTVILGGTNGIGNGVGNLTLGNYSQTIDNLLALSIGTAYNTITIAPEHVLTISGANGIFVGLDAGVASETRVKMTGGGALAVTHANANVTLGKGQSDEAGTGTGVLDLSELGSVTLGSSTAPINELRVAYGQMSSATLTLSNTNNLITANTVNIGNSFLLNAGIGTMILGSGLNTLSANTLNIGLYKGNATVKFAAQTPGSAGSVTVIGKNKPTVDIVIGSKGAMPSGAVTVGVLDLRGHEATIAAGSVTIGREDNATGNVYTGGAMGWLYFDGGAFSMTNLVMAYKSGINTGVNARATATLTVSGGEFIIAEGGTFSFASQTGTGIAIATNNILGGTFRSYADIRTGASNCLSVINLEGGTLDMTRHAIGVGAQTVTVFNVRSGTLMNLGQFNNGAPLVKTGSGSLTLAGTNTYSGVTVVSNGVLRLTGGACLPETADLYLSAGTSCQLDYTGILAIHALYIDGVRKRGTLYNATNLDPFLSGTGNLQLMYQGTLLVIQ